MWRHPVHGPGVEVPLLGETLKDTMELYQGSYPSIGEDTDPT